MAELEQLLSRIHSGKKLTKSELDEISEILRSVQFQEVGMKLSADDIYLLLGALARAAEPLDEKLFERFFDFQDPTTAALVAATLCSSKEGRSNYLERLLNLALGSDWDPDGDVQQEAIELLGEFVLENPEAEGRKKNVLKFLFELFEDERSSSDIKKWSYTALLRSAGCPEEQLPSRYAQLDFSPGTSRISWETLTKLKNLL